MKVVIQMMGWFVCWKRTLRKPRVGIITKRNGGKYINWGVIDSQEARNRNNIGFFCVSYIWYTNICLLTRSQFRFFPPSSRLSPFNNKATDDKVAGENEVDMDSRVTEEAALGRAKKSLIGFGEAQKNQEHGQMNKSARVLKDAITKNRWILLCHSVLLVCAIRVLLILSPYWYKLPTKHSEVLSNCIELEYYALPFHTRNLFLQVRTFRKIRSSVDWNRKARLRPMRVRINA